MERGVLVQRSMGPRHIIIGGISAGGPAQVRFAKHDHVVETFAADRADESLDVSILPGRSGCDRMVPNAHCTDPLQEDRTIRGVSIPNEISRRVVPRERLGDLARDPLRGWVCRHAKRYPKSSSVAYNDKTIQNLECDRRQDKEVDRRDAVDVIAEKRPPALRRWPRVAAHVPSDRRLGDLEAELEQLTVNTRRAPQGVRTAHLANERAQLSRDLRSANTVAGSPAPIRPEPSTVPANDGLRPDDRNHLKDGRKPPIEPNKYKTIRIVEVRSLRRSPAKHIELLPQDQVFRFQRCSRLEARGQDTENLNRSVIRMRAYAVRLLRLGRIEFSVHTIEMRYVGEGVYVTRVYVGHTGFSVQGLLGGSFRRLSRGWRRCRGFQCEHRRDEADAVS